MLYRDPQHPAQQLPRRPLLEQQRHDTCVGTPDFYGVVGAVLETAQHPLDVRVRAAAAVPSLRHRAACTAGRRACAPRLSKRGSQCGSVPAVLATAGKDGSERPRPREQRRERCAAPDAGGATGSQATRSFVLLFFFSFFLFFFL